MWRIPGTVNRKVPDAPVPCRIVKTTGNIYSLTELREILTVAEPAPATTTSDSFFTERRNPFTRANALAMVDPIGHRFLNSTEGGQNNAANNLCMALGHFITTDDHPGFWTYERARRGAGPARRSGTRSQAAARTGGR